MVHYNRFFPSLEKAIIKPGHVVILALLFDVSEENNSFLEPFIQSFDRVVQAGEPARLPFEFN